MELDLSKPLIPKFLLDEFWQKVKYKGIPHICFSCGYTGYNSLVCPHKTIEANHVSKCGQTIEFVGMSYVAPLIVSKEKQSGL